ncbi:P-loop NTPase [Phyllobacterium chamaecytisi]|uniref:P-loop NTPase n=1 Tax=Phyllobacterium chamaecytisi TaxID=2876082 RepID=UPI001CC99EA9|nr:SIR2 family protein [Phyllobacterium sp. KW56]MBZ9604935.1 tetratricopeptide repeat protein [Phyllobacterium sp. KW56]
MVEISAANERLLLKALNEGELFLILGAGASATCKNAVGEPVKQSGALAELIAETAGLEYSNDPLSEVIGAVLGRRMSEEKLHQILRAEYTRIVPSPELEALLNFTWRRIYTWNIDDALNNVRGGVQRRRYFNGLADKVAVHEGLDYLHVVHLHGEAVKPEHGFIFSNYDYNSRLNRDAHDWYRSAADDYIAHTPVFIGSKLNEPIMAAELDRARPDSSTGLGIAFLVTPDKFSDIQRASLEARNIVIIKATLEEFVSWLNSKIQHTITPVNVAQNVNAFANALTKRVSIDASDLATANSIIVRSWRSAKIDADAMQGQNKARTARLYLEGTPPTWAIAASSIPVWLKNTDELYEEFVKAITERDRLFLVYGQSGSGKTTAVLQAILRFSRENPTVPIYELRGDVPSLRAALNLVRRLHETEHVIVYVADAFIFGDSLSEDILGIPQGKLTIVTSARSGEWRDHIQRRVGDICTAFQYQRFVPDDYEPLIQRLLEYVPAPRFKKMQPAARIAKLNASNSQLLIALKETTESKRFTDVITDEFQKLPSDDSRLLALLVGIPTIARTGVTQEAVRESYNHLKMNLTFEEAMQPLDGIVVLDTNGRYLARHELYMRHIVENVASLKSVVDSMVEILRTYTKYRLPILKTVGRQDGILFRFLLNHNFIAPLAKRRDSFNQGLRLYESFEIDFQLDGHYWLQYGQYLVTMGELERALGVLNKSLQAYPNNPYAAHAYADLQLRVATARPNYDAVAVQLIGDAVKTLEGQHEQGNWEWDQYPIVTLAEKHVGTLLKHNQNDQAREAARRYFKIIEDLARRNPAGPLQRARETLAQYIATGLWGGNSNIPRNRPSESGGRSSRSRWRK